MILSMIWQKMAQDPETNRWWKETDPCQKRIDGALKSEWVGRYGFSL